MNNVELAGALFTAFSNGDADTARQLCADDFVGRQNNGPPMNLDALLKFTLAVHRVVADFRYEDAIRTATTAGFVEEHNVRGTLPDGGEINLAACVVAHVVDGRVQELREYLDTAAAAGLVEALSSRA